MDTPTFASPEEAVQSSFGPGAEAHVVRVEMIDAEHVDVIIDVVPSRPMRCHSYLTPDGWADGGDIVD